MTEGEEISFTGISPRVFIIGLIIAILVSSFISIVVTSQWIRGVQDPTGTPDNFFMTKTASDIISTTETMQYIDMTDMAISITLNERSKILILASVTARARLSSM